MKEQQPTLVDFKNNILKRLGAIYTQSELEFLYKEMAFKSKDVREAMFLWLETGIETKLSAEKWDVDSLKNAYSMNYIAAILTIDWLYREPVRALKSLERGLK